MDIDKAIRYQQTKKTYLKTKNKHVKINNGYVIYYNNGDHELTFNYNIIDGNCHFITVTKWDKIVPISNILSITKCSIITQLVFVYEGTVNNRAELTWGYDRNRPENLEIIMVGGDENIRLNEVLNISKRETLFYGSKEDFKKLLLTQDLIDKL